MQVEIVAEENKRARANREHGWQPGESGNPLGRPKGVPNKVTLEVKELSRKLLASKRYKRSLLRRIEDGTLPPAVETMLWHYAFGKPKETVQLEGDGSTVNILVVMEKLKQVPTPELKVLQQLLLEAETGEGEG